MPFEQTIAGSNFPPSNTPLPFETGPDHWALANLVLSVLTGFCALDVAVQYGIRRRQRIKAAEMRHDQLKQVAHVLEELEQIEHVLEEPLHVPEALQHALEELEQVEHELEELSLAKQGLPAAVLTKHSLAAGALTEHDLAEVIHVEHDLVEAKHAEMEETDKKETKEENKYESRYKRWLAAAFGMAIAGAVLFILTEDMHRRMVWVDFWTIAHVFFAALGVIAVRVEHQKKDKSKPKEPARKPEVDKGVTQLRSKASGAAR